VVVPRLASDLAGHCLEAAEGRPFSPVKFRTDACVTVVLATEGYPAAPRTGDVIDGLDAAAGVPGVTVFHAGTKPGADGTVVTAGGRVLDVTAVAPTLAEARARAYEAAGLVSWPGVRYRRDIAAGPA
jgi:phosphoribosylamine--glycine ligase